VIDKGSRVVKDDERDLGPVRDQQSRVVDLPLHVGNGGGLLGRKSAMYAACVLLAGKWARLNWAASSLLVKKAVADK
jgi:hypothetical protein